MKVWQARAFLAVVAVRMFGLAWVLMRAPQWDKAPTFAYLLDPISRPTWSVVLVCAGLLILVGGWLATEWAIRASLALAAGLSAVWAASFAAADLIESAPSMALVLFTSFTAVDLIVAGIPVFRQELRVRTEVGEGP